MNTSLSWNPALFSHKWNRERSFGIIILAALIAFEVFNYGTTEFALSDLMGDLRFGSIRWATILALAFCGMDFAGLARLFTPQTQDRKAGQTWYLFGAWLLAAAMNAVLTWWGVTIALLNHETLGSALISRRDLLQFAPVFVAVMVWIIRVLMIGAFSMTGVSLPRSLKLEKEPSGPTPVIDRRARNEHKNRNEYTIRRIVPLSESAKGLHEPVRSLRNGPRPMVQNTEPFYADIPGQE